MADKKTSEENNGVRIEAIDEFRIARSGSNYKLSSEDIHLTTLAASGTLDSYRTDSKLIAGHNYLIEVGYNDGFTDYEIIVTAISNNQISTSAFVKNITDGAFSRCELDVTTLKPNVVFDGNGNTIYGYFDAVPTNRYVLNTGFNNTIYNNNCTFINIDSTNWKNNTINNSILNNVRGVSDNFVNNNIIGSTIDFSDLSTTDSNNSLLSNSNIRRAQITFIEYSSGFENNFIFNTSLLLSDNYLNELSITGKTTSYTYIFPSGTTIQEGTIVYGEFSTLEYVLENKFAVADTVQIPTNYEWVGTFILPSTNEVTYYLQYLIGANNHTPFKLKTKDGYPLTTVHINSIAEITGNDIFYPLHHGSVDDFRNQYCWMSLRYDTSLGVNFIDHFNIYPNS